LDCWYLQLRTSLPTKGYILITFARDLILLQLNGIN
ncbi:hypothetical protein NIES298_46030, partial, partial [Microcystis aeruginosa 11-30S32]